jgi:hypothetical protein
MTLHPQQAGTLWMCLPAGRLWATVICHAGTFAFVVCLQLIQGVSVDIDIEKPVGLVCNTVHEHVSQQL